MEGPFDLELDDDMIMLIQTICDAEGITFNEFTGRAIASFAKRNGIGDGSKR